MVSAHGLLRLSATRLAPQSNINGRRGGAQIRSDSRPPFSLWTEIAVRTPTDTRRLNHAQSSAIVIRKSLKSIGQQRRRPISVMDLPLPGHRNGPGFGAETFFFTHPLEFVPNLHARRHGSGSARQRKVRPKRSGLQKLLLQSHKWPQPAPRPFASNSDTSAGGKA